MGSTRATAFQPPPHGTPARYQGPRRHKRWDPCRCTDCRTAMRRTEKLQALRRQQGHTGYQARAAAADHIRALLVYGWTGQQVADAAHVSRKTVFNILNSHSVTVHYDTAQAILGLTPAQRPGDTALSVGTMRRIHALAAMGWPLAWTAEKAGISYTGLRDISAGRTRTVQRPIHDAIAALYRTHAMRLGPSEVARRVALGKGWPTAMCWAEDAIDDPLATHEQIAEVTPLTRNELAALRRDEVRHLDQFGISEQDIAARLGMALSTVHSIVRELRTGERRDRKQAA